MELISREDLLKQIGRDSRGIEGSYGDEWKFLDTIRNMPTVESRPKGKWIVSKKDSNYNCSICGCNPRKSFRASSLEWIREINGCDMQYCPWCGTEMESEE